jgi:hypothetical protein
LKKIGAFVFLVGAVFLLITARKGLTAEKRETTVLTRRMADAQQRETAISRLKNTVAMENLDVLSKETDHKDAGAEKLQLAKDSASLGQLEAAERILGSTSAQENGLKGLQHHHWVILAEFMSGGLLGLLGVGLLF